MRTILFTAAVAAMTSSLSEAVPIDANTELFGFGTNVTKYCTEKVKASTDEADRNLNFFDRMFG